MYQSSYTYNGEDNNSTYSVTVEAGDVEQPFAAAISDALDGL